MTEPTPTKSESREPADAAQEPSDSSAVSATNDSPANNPRVAWRDESTRDVLPWVMRMMFVWGVAAALFVVRYDYLHKQLNFVKPAIVIACTLVVLGGWQLALRRRAARRDSVAS